MSGTLDMSEFDVMVADLATAGVRAQAPVGAATVGALHGTAALGSRFAPRLTGYLAGSITVDVYPDGLGGEVGPEANYGDDVEYGTVYAPAQPYMGPAALAIEDPYANAVADAAVGVLT